MIFAKKLEVDFCKNYFLGVDSDDENEQAITDSEDEVDYQNVIDKDESLINQLITKEPDFNFLQSKLEIRLYFRGPFGAKTI